MNDTTVILEGHTKKYNIPVSHLERKYIQNCTNGTELEQIYKELISGEEGLYPMLEQLTFDRIKNVQPNSQILRQDRSLTTNNEPQQVHDFSTVQDHQINGNDSIPSPSNDKTDNSTLPILSAPVINKTNKRLLPKSSSQWGKLEQKISREFNSDNEDSSSKGDEKSSNNSHSSDQHQEKSPLLPTAEHHRLNGNIALKSNNYQQSIDSYTKSLTLDNNSLAYMNRAIAYLRLDNYDASIQDCSQVLSTNSQHMKALFCRASCFLVKQQYDEAKHDLNLLLTIDSDNNQAQNLLNTITNVQKTNTTQVVNNNELVDTQTLIISSLNIPLLEIEEEEEQEDNKSMNIDIPQRQNIHSELSTDSPNASPSMSDRKNLNQFQFDDEDDDMPLGGEAGVGSAENPSDEEGYVSHSLNVSPTMNEESDVPELVDHKPFQTPSSTSPTRQLLQNNSINQTSSFTNDRKDIFSTISQLETDDDQNDLYDNNKITTRSNKSSSYKQNTLSTNPFENDNDDDEDDSYMQQRSSTGNTTNDVISKSNFSSTIQNWLRDTVKLQSSRHSSSYYERPWSKSMRPWSTDKVQRDIERFDRFNDFPNVIEASKKMLNSGVLDYHQHAEYIVETLVRCSQWYSKRNDYVHAIQYATEALQYDKTDSNALIIRGKAFENEKLLVFSYADYTRVKSSDFSYRSTLRALEKLTADLNSSEGETWREKLPLDTNDDERYLSYIKIRDSYSATNSYEWYQTHADQLYLDACFVLAIQCYTYCIEIKPDIILAYLTRATCYLKVFEPQKSIDDCNMVLKEDSKNLNALYYKACAYKMMREYRSYELTLKEYLKLQPNNQIILAEYYTSRHEQIPRKKRRIRMESIPSISTHRIEEEDRLSFEQLEQIRLEKIFNTSLESNNIKEQCSFILHLPETKTFAATTKLVEIIIETSRIMIQAEQHYQQEHRTSILPFSYIQYCFHILVELTTLPDIEEALAMIDDNYRTLLNDLLSYYSSISTVLNNVDKLNDLRKL